MTDLIETLKARFADDPMVYVSGNMLMFYEEGNNRKHLAPDVFVVRGVPKRLRDNYLVWEEGKGPDLVIEITSKTTRREDQTKKLGLYRDVLRVPEYFQFDPTEDYLKPSMQGHRLRRGRYVPVEPTLGRLPALSLGLHLERDGHWLRLFDPQSGRRLLTPAERAAQAEADRRLTEDENERLRREIEGLKKRLSGS
jgi:Uma2 family endonuclease